MKATHRGTIKTMVHIFTHMNNDGFMHKNQLTYLLDNCGKEIDLIDVGSDVFETTCQTMSFDRFDLTNITEIKPSVEIPETPFWVELSTGCHDVVASKEKAHQVNCVQWEGCDRFYHFGNTITPSFDYTQVSNKLNNGTWKIVDEPKKEMRPYTDEEWREWFLNDGVAVSENNQILHRMLNHDPKKGFYIVNLFGGKTLLSHEYLSSQLVDRHGNKFEKEVTK